MDFENSRFAAEGIIIEASRAFENMRSDLNDPSVSYRPKLSIDGNKWCALYGDNLQDGVCGFGDSPREAMNAFNIAWNKKI